MGMFDSFYILDENEKRVCCAAGHVQRGELQTKDLACDLDVYRYFAGALYLFDRNDDSRQLPPRVDGDRLVFTTERSGARRSFTSSVDVYVSCDECDPVVSEKPKAGWDGSVTNGDQPWCEWTLVFKDDVLVDVVPVNLQTREDVRADRLKRPGTVLPDDDRVARKHVERYHAERLARAKP